MNLNIYWQVVYQEANITPLLFLILFYFFQAIQNEYEAELHCLQTKGKKRADINEFRIENSDWMKREKYKNNWYEQQ